MYTIFQLVAVLTYKQISIYQWYFIAEISMGKFNFLLKLFCILGLTGGLSSTMVTALAIVTDDCRHKLKPVSDL